MFKRFETFIFEVLYNDGLLGHVAGAFSGVAAINRSAFESICGAVGVCFLGLFVQSTRILPSFDCWEIRRYPPSTWNMQDFVHFVQGSGGESGQPAPE